VPEFDPHDTRFLKHENCAGKHLVRAFETKWGETTSMAASSTQPFSAPEAGRVECLRASGDEAILVAEHPTIHVLG
jgi:hypothetical protein